MGWASGTNAEGRDVGYAVSATCDLEGCDEKIDRGLGYVCGGMHDGDEHGCGQYFCSKHLQIGIPLPQQLCDACASRYETDHAVVCARAIELWEADVEPYDDVGHLRNVVLPGDQNQPEG